jgi:hypothetical protein
VHAAQLTEPALEPIPGHGGVLESGDDEADPRLRAYRTRERGSGSPDLEMRGPNALPLSRDAL